MMRDATLVRRTRGLQARLWSGLLQRLDSEGQAMLMRYQMTLLYELVLCGAIARGVTRADAQDGLEAILANEEERQMSGPGGIRTLDPLNAVPR